MMTSHITPLSSGACRVFHRHHGEVLDGTAPVEVQEWMRAHAAECPACARFDVRLRRGLMVLRALPAVVPSPALTHRLATIFPRHGLVGDACPQDGARTRRV